MPVVPTPPTIRDEVVPSSTWNQFRDAINFVHKKPIGQMSQSSVQSIPNSAVTVITLNTEVVDTDPDSVGGHDNVTNNSRFTSRYAGWYLLNGGVSYSANATGFRITAWYVNGTALTGSDCLVPAVSGASTRMAARGMLAYLEAGDYVEMVAFQNSGGALNTAVGFGSEQSLMTVTFERTG